MAETSSSNSPFIDPAPVIDNPNQYHPSTPFIATLISNAVSNNATDIHLRPRSSGPVLFRSRGVLKKATNWQRVDWDPIEGSFATSSKPAKLLTDSNGLLVDHEEFDRLNAALTGDAKGANTVVYRLSKNHQIRVERLQSLGGEKLFVRVQPRTPPSITTTFASSPATIQLIDGARGLVLVCGELGKGKSTLCSGIASRWASLGKHVLNLEDPVEYIIDAKEIEGGAPKESKDHLGELSYLNCRFLSDVAEKGDTRPTLEQAIPRGLRSDIDALQLGEIRTATTLAIALEIANAGKPVATTYHAGSIGSAITRILAMATRILGADAAKLTVAQSLHAVLYVSLAYNQNGQPVPVVMCLPVAGHPIRRLIATSNPETLAQEIDNELAPAKGSSKGSITKEEARRYAAELKATSSSIAAALPENFDFLKKT